MLTVFLSARTEFCERLTHRTRSILECIILLEKIYC